MLATTPRRQAILDAALTLFLEHGVPGASIEDVCARAGSSVGSIYHHFGGKSGLAGAVFLAALADYQANFVTELHAHGDDAESGIRGVVRAHLSWCLDSHADQARFLLFHGDAARGADGEALSDLNRAFFAEVLRWWRPHVHYRAVRDLDLDLAYVLWLGPAQEYCRLHLADRTSVRQGHAAQALADAAWQCLRPTEGAPS